MLETITVPKTYSNKEVAQILGCSEDYVRQLKNRNEEVLIDLWRKDGTKTEWSQEGLDKLAELASTLEAKEYCRTALARRTQEAIAITRSEINDETIAINQDSTLYQNEVQNTSTRTGHETTGYSTKDGRYSQLPEKLGGAIAGQMINDGAVDRIDKAVVNGLLRGLNIGDIDIESLIGQS
jgi:hypothetical protein